MRTRAVCLVLAGLALAAAAGCGPAGGSSTVNVPELGLTMALPVGWVADPSNPRMFYDREERDDNFGMVEDYPLEGKTLAEYVDALPAMGAKFLSKTPLTISGHDAFEIVSQAAYTVIEVNIKKGDRVIRVSFRALTEDFPEHEASMREALQGIVLK